MAFSYEAQSRLPDRKSHPRWSVSRASFAIGPRVPRRVTSSRKLSRLICRTMTRPKRSSSPEVSDASGQTKSPDRQMLTLNALGDRGDSNRSRDARTRRRVGRGTRAHRRIVGDYGIVRRKCVRPYFQRMDERWSGGRFGYLAGARGPHLLWALDQAKGPHVRTNPCLLRLRWYDRPLER